MSTFVNQLTETSFLRCSYLELPINKSGHSMGFVFFRIYLFIELGLLMCPVLFWDGESSYIILGDEVHK